MTYTQQPAITANKLSTNVASITFRQPISFDVQTDQDGAIYVSNTPFAFNVVMPSLTPQNIMLDTVAAKLIAIFRVRAINADKLVGTELTAYNAMKSVVTSLIIAGNEYVKP